MRVPVLSEQSTTIEAISSRAVRWVTMPPSSAIFEAPTASVTFITIGRAMGTEAITSERDISSTSASGTLRKPTCDRTAERWGPRQLHGSTSSQLNSARVDPTQGGEAGASWSRGGGMLLGLVVAQLLPGR